jgi:hypothetical protein
MSVYLSVCLYIVTMWWNVVVSVRSIHFWGTVLKVFHLCAQYTLLIYRHESVRVHDIHHPVDGLESVLFAWAVYISDVASGKCFACVHSTRFLSRSTKYSVSVHSTHFWYTVWKAFSFCAQYTFMIANGLIILQATPSAYPPLAPLRSHFTVMKPFPFLPQLVSGNRLPYGCARYGTLSFLSARCDVVGWTC